MAVKFCIAALVILCLVLFYLLWRALKAIADQAWEIKVLKEQILLKEEDNAGLLGRFNIKDV